MVLCGSGIRVPVMSQAVGSHCAWSWRGIHEDDDGFFTVPDLLGSRFISCFASLRKHCIMYYGNIKDTVLPVLFRK